jgi:hypothetical protein
MASIGRNEESAMWGDMALSGVESAVWRLRRPQFRGRTLLILETGGAPESSAMRGWALSLYVIITYAKGRDPTQAGCLIRSAPRRWQRRRALRPLH